MDRSSKVESLIMGASDLCSDSRKVKPGCAFFALKGSSHDGNDFIEQAIKSGASVVITDSADSGDKILRVQNVIQELHYWVQKFYTELPENLILVTGTNGKTSVVHYCMQILSALAKPSAAIGTLGCVTDRKINGLEEFDLTTPDLITLRKNLNLLKKAGFENVALEASSHALDQGRLFGLMASAIGFTSFSSEHLDYHKTMEAYLEAKLKIFYANARPETPIVLNSSLLNLIPADVLKRPNVSILGRDIRYSSTDALMSGQRIRLSKGEQECEFFTSILGSYQADNIVMAAALVNSLGADWNQVCNVLPSLQAPPGRLERIRNNIFIDFAHNSEGMEKLLSTVLKAKALHQKIWLIFGCGGDRDAKKRPQMGLIAQKADFVLVTDDNPRFEDPARIRSEIISACPKAMEFANRAEAIEYAVKNMSKEDVLLIAGKGHEDYQLIQGQRIAFSDKGEVLKHLGA